MGAMSLVEAPRQTPRASVAQVVVGSFASVCALVTAYAASLIGYHDVFARPGGIRGEQYDELGRSSTGLSQVWHDYSSLLWIGLALVVLVLAALMWRAIARSPRGAWFHVLLVLAVCAGFWAFTMQAGRFTFA